MSKTHWKKQFNYDYLGSYSIPPNTEPIYTILKTQKEMVTADKGKKEECFIMYFEEVKKPMILNKTNAKAIETAYQTPFIEDWIGKKVQLYVDTVSAFGSTVEALRIKVSAPDQELPRITKNSQAWKNAIKYYIENEKFDSIEKRFKLTKEDKELIKQQSVEI